MRASGRLRWLGRAGWVAGWLLAALAWAGAPAAAREGDSRAGLFIGTTTFAVDSYTTHGTTFGGSYGYEFQNDLMWTIGGAFSSTNGDAIVNDAMGNPQVVQLRANSAALQTGLMAFFNRSGGRNSVIPYVGAGLSFLNYDLTFPGTNIGTTSGTGPGAYAQVGVELRMTQSVTLIPQFGVQVHTIKTQSGESRGLLSGGLVLTVRLST